MNESTGIRRWLIQGLLVFSGLVTTLLIAQQVRRPQAIADQVVRAAFEQLPASEQSAMLEKARLLSQSPEELQRLQTIHDAVTADADLQKSLETFGAWWQKLGREERSRLRNNGSFVTNWAREAQDLYAETQYRSTEIVKEFPRGFGMPPVVFTRHDFRQFLDAVIEQPSPSLREQLSDLDPDQHRCEIVLAKTVWVVNELLNLIRDRGRGDDSQLSADRVVQATVDYLLQDSAQEGNQALRARLEERPLRDPRSLFTILFVVKEGLDHQSDIFQSRHLGNEREQLVQAFAQEDRGEQLQLMRMSPEEAQNALSNRLILERPTLEPGVARLADRVEQLRERFRRLSGPGPERRDNRPRPPRPPSDGPPSDGPPDDRPPNPGRRRPGPPDRE